MVSLQAGRMPSLYILLALVVLGIGVVEVASVLHGDGVALLGLVGAIAWRDELLGNTHGCGLFGFAVGESREEESNTRLMLKVNPRQNRTAMTNVARNLDRRLEELAKLVGFCGTHSTFISTS